MQEKISKTMNYYDAISKGYGELYHQEQIKKITLIKNHIRQFKSTLDLGGGDGVFNEFITDKAKFVSFDLSYELLKKNTNQLRVQGSATMLPFKDNCFEQIISFTMIQDTPDPRIIIDEVKRVLKNNGIFIVSFLHMSSKAEIIKNKLEKDFEMISRVKEEKDLIYVLKKK